MSMAGVLRNCARTINRSECMKRSYFNVSHSAKARCFAITSTSRCHHSTTAAQSPLSTEPPPSTPPNIIIPKRKKRDELSVLKALSSTIKKDYGGPHTQFIDDPYLIPYDSYSKRIYSVSKVSGKNAARYILGRFPQHFVDNFADPFIPDYMPEPGYVNDQTTEEGLRERIARRDVTEAYTSYNSAIDAGSSISEKTKLDLLELLCFYNSKSPEPLPEPAERQFTPPVRESAELTKKTWQDKGPAETIFKEFDSPNARAYAAMIKGRAKYFQVDRAHDLFREMLELKLPMDLGTFNAILKIVPFLVDKLDKKMDLTREILCIMKELKVTPDVQSFANILWGLGRSRRLHRSADYAMSVINEMKNLNMEPSLACWYHLLTIFYPNSEAQSNLLYDVMDHLEGQKLEIVHPDDRSFFAHAMQVCSINVQDMELAYRIERLLNSGPNYLCLGDVPQEGKYYTHYVRMLCLFEQLEVIMEEWSKLTPHCFSPRFTAIDELLTAIELNEGYNYIPKIYSDIEMYRLTGNFDILEKLLAIMSKEEQPSEMHEPYMYIVEDVWKKIDESDDRRRRPIKPSGEMIGKLCLICVNSGNVQKAWDIMKFYIVKKRQISGFLGEACLVKLMRNSMEIKDKNKCMDMMKLMSDCAYPHIDKYADDMKTAFDLNERERNLLEDLL